MEYPKRKHPRLKTYDYSQPGYYYVTVHLEEAVPRLSVIRQVPFPARPAVELSETGKIARAQLLELENRYDYVKIDKYVIMPTHIHMIVQLRGETAGASPRPTLPDIICAYKSLTTRLCNQQQQTPGRKLFQTSFYETVLRSERAYRECWKYVDGNPDKWIAEEKQKLILKERGHHDT